MKKILRYLKNKHIYHVLFHSRMMKKHGYRNYLIEIINEEPLLLISCFRTLISRENETIIHWDNAEIDYILFLFYSTNTTKDSIIARLKNYRYYLELTNQKNISTYHNVNNLINEFENYEQSLCH